MAYTGEAKNAYQLLWMRKARKAWLAEHGPCVWCGSHEQLEVDHIDPSRKKDHKVWSWSAERREKELENCQVLCKKCNLWKMAVLRLVYYAHGTYGRYKKYRCRCTACRGANARARQEQRKRKLAGEKGA